MQQVYIPSERMQKLLEDKKLIKKVENLCNCKIEMADDELIQINGEAVAEFSARNIIYAFGRGFDIDVACKLINNDYYFTSIDLEQIFGSEKRVQQIRARVIGENGRTKKYIESVSLANISIYGKTISFIGTITEVNEAEVAVNTLIEGGTHRVAYSRMEAAHRKNRETTHNPEF